ncbi:hypothetical protein Bca4012_083379 [Brassica carinata]|uniref:Uncharacterized protein n=1 Tax=Brassica carinata TaxID=52824 RepID=A0A8X7VAG7_BRACI|nr:hypothetical protein Bca52824_027374 [Brassica carinata]
MELGVMLFGFGASLTRRFQSSRTSFWRTAEVRERFSLLVVLNQQFIFAFLGGVLTVQIWVEALCKTVFFAIMWRTPVTVEFDDAKVFEFVLASCFGIFLFPS